MAMVSSTLVADSEGQVIRKASTVPLCEAGVAQHSGREQRPARFQAVQWPDKASSLYRPDSSLDWVTAFSTSHGENPHDRNSGQHLVKDMNPVLR